MNRLISILVGLLIFSAIIIFHELGHFLLAKKNGIKVPEFSLGMGPRLFSFDAGGTKFSLKLFLIGGACQMLGEDADNDEEGSFNSKGPWQRFATVFAGPFFNFILAFVVSVIIMGIVGYDPAIVTRVETGSPADAIGLKTEDIITSFNGKTINMGRELETQFQFDELTADPVKLSWTRDGEKMSAILVPELLKSYKLGFYYTADANPASVSQVIEGGTLANAGVKAGDIITSMNGVQLESGQALYDYVRQSPFDGSEIQLTILRGDQEISLSAIPQYEESYSMGFTFNYSYREKVGPLKVLKYSLCEVRYWIVTTFKSLGQLVTGKIGTESLGGPVRIVSEVGNTIEASKEDGTLYVVLNLLEWAVLLSANLGVMNLLPIPALDGGRLVFLLIEGVRGKPIDREKEGMVHAIGLILLLALMVFVFFNDIRNIIR